jgi:hypothetical protein
MSVQLQLWVQVHCLPAADCRHVLSLLLLPLLLLLDSC